MARIWRDGQKKPVFIYRLLSTATIEERVYQRQISKVMVSKNILDRGSMDELFTREELKDLLSFPETRCLTHDLIQCNCNGRSEIHYGKDCFSSILKIDPFLYYATASDITFLFRSPNGE
jgi:DNA repair and recombination protein RAD54B